MLELKRKCLFYFRENRPDVIIFDKILAKVIRLFLFRENNEQGSLVMLGSLTQLARVGTAFYISEWCKRRDRILRDLGDVLVVPWLPLLSEAAVGRHVVRCVAEFLDWFDDLQDPEASMLRALRREFCCAFMPQNGKGEKYGDILQNFMLPHCKKC